MTNSATPSRRSLVWALRIVALLIVAWFVSGSVRSAFDKLSAHDWHVQPAWLIFSGAIYVLALVPMGWFWQRTLAALGCPTPLPNAMRAYFLGHIGKYVPGKAMSVILRVAAVRKWVPSMRIALVSTLIETLTMMAAGALAAALIAALILHLDYYIWLAAFGMAAVSVAPTLPPVAKLLARLGLNRNLRNDEASVAADSTALPAADVEANLQGLRYSLLAKGWFAAAICWLLQGVSLWATLRAIGVEDTSLLHDLPRLIAAVSFSVVAGFLSQLPAGIVVRDGLLFELLKPIAGDANALVAAVLVRLVWLVSEVIVCGILYIAAARKP